MQSRHGIALPSWTIRVWICWRHLVSPGSKPNRMVKMQNSFDVGPRTRGLVQTFSLAWHSVCVRHVNIS